MRFTFKSIVSLVISLFVANISFAQLIPSFGKLEQNLKNDLALKIGRNDFKGYVELRKVENDTERLRIEAESAYYSNIQKLGDGKLKLALAAYADQMLEVLRHEYKRVIFAEQDLQRKQLDIELKINLTLDLKRGQTHKAVFIGLDYLFTYIIPSNIVIEQMTKKIDTLDVDDLVPNIKNAKIVVFQGKTVGDFLMFLKDNDYSVKPWSKSHIILLKMFEGFDNAANVRIAALEERMNNIRKGTLPVWQLPQVK